MLTPFVTSARPSRPPPKKARACGARKNICYKLGESIQNAEICRLVKFQIKWMQPTEVMVDSSRHGKKLDAFLATPKLLLFYNSGFRKIYVSVLKTVTIIFHRPIIYVMDIHNIV